MNDVNKPKIGRYIQQKEGWKSFTLFEFPPKGGFGITPRLHKKHEEAIRLMGKLDGIMRLLPDKDYFLQMFVNKDAALSSQIEGTKATLQDAVAAPVTEEKSQLPPDVDDILHYAQAANYGIERSKELPISLRLIGEIHEKLMVGARSTHHAYSGEFRRSQNWIGGKTPHDASFRTTGTARYARCLRELERFIHSKDEYPVVNKGGSYPCTIRGQSTRLPTVMAVRGVCWCRCISIMRASLSSLYSISQAISRSTRSSTNQKLQEYHDEEANIEGWLEFFLEGVAGNSSICDRDMCVDYCVARTDTSRRCRNSEKSRPESTLGIVHKLFGQADSLA